MWRVVACASLILVTILIGGGLGGLVGESVCEGPPDDFMRCAMEDFLGVSLGALTGFFVGVFIVQVLYALSHDE